MRIASAVFAALTMISASFPAYGSIDYTVGLAAPSGSFSITTCIPSPFGGQQCTTVTINLGSESLTGEITTDGTLGQLGVANFTAWSIAGSGAVSFNVFSDFSPLGSSSSSLSCRSSGCGVTATATELDFTGDDSTGLTFANEFSGSFGSPIGQIEELSFGTGAFTVLVGDTTGFPSGGVFQLSSGDYTIAKSGQAPGGGSAPEPNSLGLVTLSLALIGAMGLRRREPALSC
jgi:hypothetical protein